MPSVSSHEPVASWLVSLQVGQDLRAFIALTLQSFQRGGGQKCHFENMQQL